MALITGIKELHFYVTESGLLCEVFLETTMDKLKSRVWKHKEYPTGTAFSKPMGELHLSLNWKTGKKSEQIEDYNGEKEQND